MVERSKKAWIQRTIRGERKKKEESLPTRGLSSLMAIWIRTSMRRDREKIGDSWAQQLSQTGLFSEQQDAEGASEAEVGGGKWR